MRRFWIPSIVTALLAAGPVPGTAGSLGLNGHRVEPLIVKGTLVAPATATVL